jgi:hypothetical protein
MKITVDSVVVAMGLPVRLTGPATQPPANRLRDEIARQRGICTVYGMSRGRLSGVGLTLKSISNLG